MSSVGRAASRGSKSGKGDHAATTKAQKSDNKTDSSKSLDNPKAQPTPEQMRIAQITDKHDDPSIKEKIKQVMDATHKTENEVCAALHDCDNDLDRAVNMLIEGQGMGEWELSVKKKKSRQPSTNTKAETVSTRGVNSADVDSENWEDDAPKAPIPTDTQQRTRGRGGSGPPRMRGRGSQDNRGWRGRENKENERNLEESRTGPGTGGSSVGGGGGGGPGGEREQRDSFRRGTGGSGRGGRMSNGPSRGGGRGGSRTGPRSFPGRGGQDRGSSFPRPTSWNNPDEDGSDRKTNNFPSPEDWDNEEYTGSLADTKVFTPSSIGTEGAPNDTIASLTVNNSNAEPPHSTPSGVSSNSLNYSQTTMGSENLTAGQTSYLRPFKQEGKLASSNALSGAMSSLSALTSPDGKSAPRGMTPSTPSSGNSYSYAASAGNTPNAAVSSSYPSSYSSVSASAPASSVADTMYSASASAVNSGYSSYQSGQSQPTSYTATATSYSTVYGTQASTYSGQDGTNQSSGAQQLPARPKTQRPRVPPPSKIPQTAVEMPGDSLSNSMGILDVQFGGLDFGSDAFETNSSEPQPSPQAQAAQASQPPSQQVQSQGSPMSKYTTGGGGGGGGLEAVPSTAGPTSMDLDPFATAGPKAAALSQTIKETLLQSQSQSQAQVQQSQSSVQSQSNDLKSQQSNYTQQSRGPAGVGVPLDSLVKNDTSSATNNSSSASGNNAGATGSLAYSAPSSNYPSSYQSQKNNVNTGYQSSAAYNSSGYSSSQTGSGVSSGVSSGAYSSSGTVSSSSANSYTAGYPASQGYQTVQSVYGTTGSNAGTVSNSAGSGVGTNSGYTTSTSGTSYQNNYGTSTASAASSNKLTSVLGNAAKDMPQYDTTATTTSNLSNSLGSSNTGAPGLSNVTGSVNNSPSLGLPGATSLSNANNTTSTKVTNSTAKSGVVPNMPPGVPPIITAGAHQYIMSQGGLQYFQQPMYSYDDQQLLPLRIGPHMTAGYYDVSFQQAPTSLATGREGSLANVPYSMSDARFARTDNASPVPSSLSQQNATQAHQQPMMNAAGFPPGYAYAYYGGSVLPANYQYGTPTAMYPQVAPATNAHGNSNSTQYAKPGSYGSSYSTGYDGLSASQDYSKAGGYAGGHSGAQSGSKAGVGTNAPSTGSSATDLYNKTHVALSKVNSYEKQGFHSGTPPPFNLAGSQNTGMAPSGAYPPPLFMPMPHQQHHSTTLMQHPMHQMDMRNPSRRSDSGNSSGQRSQSSVQSNKPGTKQSYSQNYWPSN